MATSKNVNDGDDPKELSSATSTMRGQHFPSCQTTATNMSIEAILVRRLPRNTMPPVVPSARAGDCRNLVAAGLALRNTHVLPHDHFQSFQNRQHVLFAAALYHQSAQQVQCTSARSRPDILSVLHARFPQQSERRTQEQAARLSSLQSAGLTGALSQALQIADALPHHLHSSSVGNWHASTGHDQTFGLGAGTGTSLQEWLTLPAIQALPREAGCRSSGHINNIIVPSSGTATKSSMMPSIYCHNPPQDRHVKSQKAQESLMVEVPPVASHENGHIKPGSAFMRTSRREEMDEKNARARYCSAKKRYKIQELHAIQKASPEELTSEEQHMLTKSQASRSKKNLRTKERELEKKRKIEAIYNKPVQGRTLEEMQYLAIHESRKLEKAENDRLRREKQKLNRTSP